MTETAPLVRLRRVPCGGRIVAEVEGTTFARVGDVGYRVRCAMCGHSYRVAAGVLTNGVCVRVRREKA